MDKPGPVVPGRLPTGESLWVVRADRRPRWAVPHRVHSGSGPIPITPVTRDTLMSENQHDTPQATPAPPGRAAEDPRTQPGPAVYRAPELRQIADLGQMQGHHHGGHDHHSHHHHH